MLDTHGPPQTFELDLSFANFSQTTAHSLYTTAKMSSAALNKIAPNSPSRQSPSETETSIANALYDLETNVPDLKSGLRPLQFVSAREVR